MRARVSVGVRGKDGNKGYDGMRVGVGVRVGLGGSEAILQTKCSVIREKTLAKLSLRVRRVAGSL